MSIAICLRLISIQAAASCALLLLLLPMMKPVSFAAASRVPSFSSPPHQDGRQDEERRRNVMSIYRNAFRQCRRVESSKPWEGVWKKDGEEKERFLKYDGLTIPACVWGFRNKLQNLKPGVLKMQAQVHQEAESPSVTVTSTEFYEDEKDEVVVDTDGALTVQLAQPLVPVAAWEKQTGNEFEDPDLVDRLAQSGLYMATQEENEYVSWRLAKDTKKSLSSAHSVAAALDDGEVLVYLGKVKSKDDGDSNNFQGGDLPLVMTKSILPLSAEDMADLLMDSSRVKTYNKMSLGRKDIRKLSPLTKIVRNVTKPPISKSKMVSVTLMHARPLDEGDRELLSNHKGLANSKQAPNGYLVVTRAVPGADKDPAYQNLTRNDIMLGVNLLQEVGPDSCLMTTVTHVYSPSLPKMLAAKVGISSAVSFVHDIRQMCKENLVGAE